MREADRWIAEFNRIWRENDKIYRDAAKAMGISECVFWILYSIQDSEEIITQREIVEGMSIPPQTVNSALKKLEADGYVRLETGNDRRSKLVRFTEKGQELAERTANPVFEAERRSVEGLPGEEKEAFLRLFTKYTDLLRTQMHGMEDKFSAVMPDLQGSAGKSEEKGDCEA